MRESTGSPSIAAVAASILAATLLGTGSGEAARAQEGPPDLRRMVASVEDAAPAALMRHAAPGVAVAIVADGEPAWSAGFGLADVEHGVPVTADTVFETASVSKPVSAWAVLILAEQGRIDLDAPIERYLKRWRLPESEYDHEQVTARRILAHAAGLSGGGDPGMEPGEPVPTLVEAANGAGQEGGGIRVATEPGAAFHYSSKGYLLLEMAVEDITGESFATFMQREVLAPLGMASSSYEWTPELRARAAVGYDWYNRPLPTYEHATRAQGGLIATAADVSRFVAATMQGGDEAPPGRGVLSPGSVAESLTPIDFTSDTTSIGLGYNLYTSSGTLVARKTGDHRGWKSALFAVPELGAGIVILTNSDRAAAGVFADIACPWSRSMPGDPLRVLCGQMYMLRNVQLGVAALLLLVAAAYVAWVLAGVRSGRRAPELAFSRRRAARVGIFVALALLWWGFWYTDLPLRQLGYPPTFVTVRFDPWPTAFVWISRSLTLLLLALAGATFAPRRR